MNLDYLCMGCMKEKVEWTPVCPYCGYDGVNTQNKPHQLPTWTLLNNTYLIGKGLGDGGFGMTYMGFDINLHKKVAIKEYFLNKCCWRNPGDLNVYFYNDNRGEVFLKERQKFVDEARILAQIDEQPGIVKVISYFEANQTAYIVMEFLDGKSLKAYLKERGERLPVPEAMEIMKPVIKAMAGIHQKGVVHRDISPDNIMLTDNGRVKLIDFGAAKNNEMDMSSDKVFKNTYSPLEQRVANGVVGPYSDVYALCATLYQIITGSKIPPAVDRQQRDNLVPPSAMGIQISPIIEAAIINGLAINGDDRIKNATDLYYFMYVYGAGQSASPTDMKKKIQESSTKVLVDKLKRENSARKIRGKIAIATAVIIILGCLIIAVQKIGQGKKADDNSSPTVSSNNNDDGGASSVIEYSTETLDEYRQEMYDVINEKRKENGIMEAYQNSTYEKTSDKIVNDTVVILNTGENVDNAMFVDIVSDAMAEYGVVNAGYAFYPCEKAYKIEEVYNLLQQKIAEAYPAGSNVIDLSNCSSVGVGVQADKNGNLYWVVVFK